MIYKNVNEILLISLSCIGDVLLTTPVMKALRDNFPGAALTVVAGPTAMPILEKHELVDATVVCENKGRHKGLRGALALALELRAKKRYDMVVDLRNTAIPYILRARYRITAHKAHIMNRDARGRHAIDRHLDVLEIAGMKVFSREMVLTIPDEVRSEVDSFKKGRGLEGKKLIAIYPGAGSPYKMYSIDKMVEALGMLQLDENAVILAIGSEPDRPVCEKLAAAFPGKAISVAGELDILHVGALLRGCELLISNDSGPMHVGVAAGTPTLAIFGPTDAERYGPRGERHGIIWHREEECNPCKFQDCGRESCVNKVLPESIAREAAGMCSYIRLK